MVKAIMHGCNGHMGRVITDIIKNTEGIELVAGVDKYTKVPNDYPVFESIDACDVEADVIIDFSNAAAADELLDNCVEKQVRSYLYYGTFRRTAGKGRRISKESSSIKICQYVTWHQSAYEDP